MRNLILTVLLTAMSTCALAEWTIVNSNDKLTIYADLQTIRKKGDSRKMWSLLDFRSQQQQNYATYVSQVTQSEYDCAEEQFRMIFSTYYDLPMGNGNSVFTYEHGNSVKPVPPNTPLRELWEIACGKVKPK